MKNGISLRILVVVGAKLWSWVGPLVRYHIFERIRGLAGKAVLDVAAGWYDVLSVDLGYVTS